MVATEQIQLNLNDCNDQELESSLKGIIQESLDSIERDLTGLETRKAQVAERLVGLRTKEARRTAIADSIHNRMEKRRREYDKARESYDKARRKAWKRTSMSTSANEELVGLANQITERRSFTRTFEETFSDNSFETRASMLRASAHLLDTDTPIVYRTTPQGAELTFRTSDVYLKDGMGGIDDTNFGKFNIRVAYSIIRSVASIRVWCMADRSRSLRSSDYVHPHVQYNGEPCLGNVQAMLLQHMKNKDIAMTVSTALDYITTYNHRDPYRVAANWGVLSLHERDMHRTSCACQLSLVEPHLTHRCPMVTNREHDIHTGEVLTEDNVAPCGCTWSSCITNHVHVPGSKGFNGSGCQLKGLAEYIPAIKSFSDSLKRQA